MLLLYDELNENSKNPKTPTLYICGLLTLIIFFFINKYEKYNNTHTIIRYRINTVNIVH